MLINLFQTIRSAGVPCTVRELLDLLGALENQLVYHISKSEEDGFAFYCSFQKILSMHKMSPGNAKDDIPEVVSASKNK